MPMNAPAYYCYLMASKDNGTLYVGVTSDLISRVYQHKTGSNQGFTKKYNVHQLVWFEEFTDIEQAIQREKQIKKWNRSWKRHLIEETNPGWDDLYNSLVTGTVDSRLRGNDSSIQIAVN